MVYEEFNQTAVQTKVGITFANGAAPHPAPGSRHHHGRRDPRRARPRSTPSRRRSPATWSSPPCTPTTPPTSITPPGRPRRRALPDQLDADRRDGAAPGAHDLPELRHRAHADARGGRDRCACRSRPASGSRSRKAPAATSAAAPATSAAPASSRSCRSTTPIKQLIVAGQRRTRDQARGGQERHAHAAPVGVAQARRGHHDLRGSGAGDRPLNGSERPSARCAFAKVKDRSRRRSYATAARIRGSRGCRPGSSPRSAYRPR